MSSSIEHTDKDVWIMTKLQEAEGETRLVYPLYLQFKKETKSDVTQSTFRRRVRLLKQEMLANYDLDFADADQAKLYAQKQKEVDKLRIQRQVNRESFRLFNLVEEFYNEYLELLPKLDLKNIKIEKAETDKVKHMIVHLSDLHLNEVVEEFENVDNEYDYTIASKRLKKFITEAIALGKAKKITNVIVISTGDLMNSTRRVSEKMVQISSLSSASLIATTLLAQVIMELSQYFKVTFGGVVGNESRIGDAKTFDMEWKLLSENWDFVIYENLKTIFKDSRVSFIEGDPREKIFGLENGFNGFFHHGDIFSKGNPEKSIREYISKFTLKGIPIHGVFFGHIHSSLIGNIFARSASLVGGNPHSNKKLGFYSRASQNIYFVSEDGESFNGMSIDLQNTDGIEGYPIDEVLQQYHIEPIRPNKNTRVVIDYLV